ncbi:hypothetical protein ACPPVO_36500 [Dactylosporangium sp. McL0621]|uniref:hypothetical protein n=1 Tax=Dactylosporangium sp. McL0621 TaxID=3415678 RepID=UPI003CEE323A
MDEPITATAGCPATKITTTATGDVEIQCAKIAKHVTQGDAVHQGRLGAFPIRWADQPTDR